MRLSINGLGDNGRIQNERKVFAACFPLEKWTFPWAGITSKCVQQHRHHLFFTSRVIHSNGIKYLIGDWENQAEFLWCRVNPHSMKKLRFFSVVKSKFFLTHTNYFNMHNFSWRWSHYNCAYYENANAVRHVNNIHLSALLKNISKSTVNWIAIIFSFPHMVTTPEILPPLDLQIIQFEDTKHNCPNCLSKLLFANS